VATGSDGGDPKREYPWPGEWDPTKCNSTENRLSRTSAVGIYPSGATKQGALDMAGNVWEWCVNKYDQPDILNASDINKSNLSRVVRGGSWGSDPEGLRSSNRSRRDAVNRNFFVGFRLAQDIE
jgi:formylglycine-generating enzyme required for sulfatase activity